MRLTNTKGAYDFLNDKSILVTGGTGSFGRLFIQNILERSKPRRVIVYSRDEFKQYEMQQTFGQEQYPAMRYFIGDVRDENRLSMAMREVDFVVHAAALKHVPAAEYNPFECIMTNVHGAEHVVRAALANGVGKVLALSTDKACNPINLYGASKLASDKIFVAANNLSGSIGTRFMVLRYGNVVGSRGSVIPFFRHLLEQKVDALPITDDRMTRFWITLQQGVDFAASVLNEAHGGEIFVPKIPSMRITDLARVMRPNLPIKIIGIRPGEKLHEVMVGEDDSRQTCELEDCYVIEPSFHWWNRDSYIGAGATRVADGFRYSSDINKQWVSDEQLQGFLKDLY